MWMLQGMEILITPVNWVWVCVAAGFAGLAAALCFLLRGKPREYRRKALLGLAAGNLALFCVYLLWFQHVPGTAYWNWEMLPVNLCNLVTILLVAALAADNRRLYCFCFYVGIAAGVMAILSPEGGLKELRLFSPIMIGFYFVHCLLYTIGISLAALKLYRPTLKDALWSVVYLEALTAVVYLVDLLLRATVHPEANFFFLFDAGGSPWLAALHGVVPVPPLTMMVSVLPVALGLFVLEWGAYRLFTRKGNGTER